MKYLFLLVFSILLCYSSLSAKDKGTDPHAMPRTEEALIGKVINALQYKDSNTYMTLFPEFDTVWKQIMEFHNDAGEEQKLGYIRKYPERVRQFDPYYNHAITDNFWYVVNKGEKEGIHWDNIVMSRYEVRKQILTRDMVGYEVIAPIRFKGYVFVKDMLTRRMFCFTLSEMHNIQGFWYGGQVLNIFEASTVEEYQLALAAEIKKQRMMDEYGLTEADLDKKDSTKQHKIKVSDDDDEDEDKPNGLTKKDVVDRKLFIGKFDNEIPVKLYIRYIRGECPEKICSWEAIYKFGDQQEYVKLDVTKPDDTTWQFVEDPPIGSMDLVQHGKVFTGSWATTDIATGYDARLTETVLTPAEAQKLDNIIQFGLWSKDNKEAVREKAAEEAKEKEERRKRVQVEGAEDVY